MKVQKWLAVYLLVAIVLSAVFAGGVNLPVSAAVVENTPPVADAQSLTVVEGGSVVITFTGTDADNDALTFYATSNPTYGTLSGMPEPNQLTYTAWMGYSGPDSFTYVANDGLAESAPAAVDITILPVNEAPQAYSQYKTTNEDTPKALTLKGSDPDGDALTYVVETGPAHGVLSGTAPALTYTPGLNYNGSDSFTFSVSDGEFKSAAATVSLDVFAVNDAPVADAQSVTVDEDGSKSITLTGSDVESSSLSFRVVSNPVHGTLSGSAPDLTYTPAPGYTGADTFTFIVSDGELDSPEATVSIEVVSTGPVNVFWDNFETNKGWVRNPNGTDTATGGLWTRANPASSYFFGVKQLGTTASGTFDLVTGPKAGGNVGGYDVDGGVTSIRSPYINLPTGKNLVLSFKYYLAHWINSSTSDYLRVKIVGATTTTILQELGASNNDNAAWATFSGNLNSYAGQTVYILIEVADKGAASLVEAAMDDVLIIAE